ncbi:hypothetical protein NPIL_380251 [Nephila pilipes]|uniref:Uncharacterized protein n=1 Tax=Nephila pilipes TaxID=299642 RepID=A0A8X6QL65_NEPPI|nr:hypothetical protein NPIL_380251 [Nephila pilipes]
MESSKLMELDSEVTYGTGQVLPYQAQWDFGVISIGGRNNFPHCITCCVDRFLHVDGLAYKSRSPGWVYAADNTIKVKLERRGPAQNGTKQVFTQQGGSLRSGRAFADPKIKWIMNKSCHRGTTSQMVQGHTCLSGQDPDVFQGGP